MLIILSLERASCFEHIVESICNTCILVVVLGATPKSMSLKFRCLVSIGD